MADVKRRSIFEISQLINAKDGVMGDDSEMENLTGLSTKGINGVGIEFSFLLCESNAIGYSLKWRLQRADQNKSKTKKSISLLL
uniref:Uncharacterized protein n=1 Tax=Romanomermis culicivorax TaxID=13658 RepID=A0A915K414_ROMCU